MNLTRFSVADGINLHYIKDTKYKTVSVSVFLRRPLLKEEATYLALLSGVLKQGTNKLSNMKDMARYLDDLYGAAYDVSVFKMGNTHNLSFDISFLSGKYTKEPIEDKCVEFLCDLIFDSKCIDAAFDKKDVETDKINLKDDIDSVINDKRAYAAKRLRDIMCEGEIVSIPSLGYKEDVDNIDNKSLYEYYRRIIFESPMEIYVVGEIDADTLVNSIRRRLSSYKFNIKSVKHIYETKSVTKVKEVCEKMNITQGKLCMGFRTNVDIRDKEYFPYLVANSILGSGAHSKLFNNVREKLSLCYYVYSYYESMHGIMKIDAGIEFDKAEEAKSEIFRQIEMTKKGEFSEDEFKAAKEFLVDRFKKYTDSPSTIKQHLYSSVISGVDYSIDEAVARIRSVTREQAIDAFKNTELDTVYFLMGDMVEE